VFRNFCYKESLYLYLWVTATSFLRKILDVCQL
jgi:hypothetical protein